MLASVPLGSQAAPRTGDYRLKAAFVYRFPQFVEWPSSALAGEQVLQICVTHPNPFGSALQELVKGETVNGRRLAARVVHGPASLTGCHVLFVSAASEPAHRAFLDRVAKQPVLTIGESSRFLDRGGIITLRVVDTRVRFEVNAQAAERAGLKLSSQLLRLAIAVRGTA